MKDIFNERSHSYLDVGNEKHFLIVTTLIILMPLRLQ